MGSAHRSAAGTARGSRSRSHVGRSAGLVGSASTRPHVGSPGRAACAARSRRPDLGRAGPRAHHRRACRTGLAADRRPGALLGCAASARGPGRAIVAYAICTRLGGPRPRRGRTRMGRSSGRALCSALRSPCRAFAPRHPRRARLGRAGARIASRHPVGSVVESSGCSRVGRPEARRSRPRTAGAGARVGRLGSSGRGRSAFTADGRTIVGRARGLVDLEPACAGVERTGRSIVGRPQDRGARSSSSSLVVRAGPRRAGRCAGAGARLGPARRGGMVRP